MPLRDGTGPFWGKGPRTGNKKGKCGSATGPSLTGGNKTSSFIAIVGVLATLIEAIAKLFLSKEEKREK
ncbi:MAG: DUF5320 domain-containing protein [bacterium]|nr:DUF5320 domain-containing protein [bacterium]MDD5756591.1 DUF5320 domain-containing protein [bacterium]